MTTRTPADTDPVAFAPADTAPADTAPVDIEPAGEPVAVIGLACRFPGADDPAGFWANLLAGVESVRRFTDDELRAAGVSERLLREPGYVRAAGWLDGLDRFDAEFFGYPARDAALTDPQHRLFLEVAWAAVEDAGYHAGRHDGSIGVFAAAGTNRYFLFNLFRNPAGYPSGSLPPDPDGLLVPGTGADHLPARVSYALGLTGPSVAVQTACSSSLVAVCLAAQSLQDFQCDLAIAGGASIFAGTPAGYLHQAGAATSPDGHCRAFDAAAAGAPPGSGAGAVVLKRLTEALADGDPVYAVLRGWAVANDGAARAGYLAPGSAGVAAAAVEALAAAGVGAGTIGYLEAHGAGTPVGDALEVDGLTRAFRSSTDRVGHCALGSVKSNIGNLDQAGGIAGLIKAVLAVRHGVIPPTLHAARPNPELKLERGPFRLATGASPWPAAGGPRRAGVSAVGQGGSNALIVLEERPPAPPPAAGRDAELLVLSARTPAALDAAMGRLRARLLVAPPPLADTGYTLAVGRAPLGHRLAIVATDPTAAAAALGDPGRRITGQRGTPPAVGFWLGDGPTGPGPADLGALAREHGFAAAVDECAALGCDLRDAGGGARFRFVATYAVAAVLADWGLRPHAVAGSGSGGAVAAYLAGALPLATALTADPVRVGGLAGSGPPHPRLVEGAADPVAALRQAGCDLVVAIEGGVPRLVGGEPGGPPLPAALRVAGAFWVRGGELDWDRFYAGQRRRRVSLPTYPFQRQRHWIDPPAGLG